MKLANRFPDDEKMRVWLDHQFCVLCGSNQQCSLHHIDGTVSKSIFNSSMLCLPCHKMADGRNGTSPLHEEFRESLREYTRDLITSQDKPLNKHDKEYNAVHQTDLN